MLPTLKWFALITISLVTAVAGLASTPVFQPQTRVGFTVGDQWEPSIAADRYGHVYILEPVSYMPQQDHDAA